MKKLVKFIGICFLCASTYANGSEKTFLLYDWNKDLLLESQGNTDTRTSPWCSFNIPLALIGFELGILESAQLPQWTYTGDTTDFFDFWKGSQTPTTWMQYSVVWYSQKLSRQIPFETFDAFVKHFHYGNKDISADYKQKPEKAWLGSTLKISPKEQLDFLKTLLNKAFVLSPQTYTLTKQILYREKLPNGWKLYGKTGYGHQDNERRTGWFVGWLEKEERKVLFVSNIRDQKKEEGMTQARDSAMQALRQYIEADSRASR